MAYNDWMPWLLCGAAAQVVYGVDTIPKHNLITAVQFKNEIQPSFMFNRKSS